MNLCDDNRIITIEKAKQALIKGTNIEDSQEEMKVLDSFLLRCWQMGWLDRYAPTRHFNAMPKGISERMAAGHGSNVPMQPNIPPMPSNTSNALDALVDAYKGRSNALENQTKWDRMMLHLADLQLTYSPDWGANGQGDQKLYDLITELIDEFSGWDAPDTNVGDTISRKAAIDALTEYGNGRAVYISVEEAARRIEQLPPTNCSEFPNNSDTISRQAAIEALDKRFDSIPMEQTTEILLLRKDLRELPPAEPKRIRGRWTCDKCGYMNIIEGTNFCPKCGNKM